MTTENPDNPTHSLQPDSAGEIQLAVSTGSVPIPSAILVSPLTRLKKCRHGWMIYTAADFGVGRSLDLYGEWAEAEMQLLARIVRPGDVVIDVGANIGTHMVCFAQQVGPSGAVVAFEPQRFLFHLLCANAALNGLTNVYCQYAALGERSGQILVPRLNPSALNNFGALALGRFSEGEPVPVITLDQVAVPSCRVVKIDVEGMEQQVLKGGRQFIDKFKPVLYVENNQPDKSAAVIDLIKSMNYDVYWHCPAGFNPDNYFRNPFNMFGAYGDINVVCIPKGSDISIEGLPGIDTKSPL
jgi:FkbM family methyltransferase